MYTNRKQENRRFEPKVRIKSTCFTIFPLSLHWLQCFLLPLVSIQMVFFLIFPLTLVSKRPFSQFSHYPFMPDADAVHTKSACFTVCPLSFSAWRRCGSYQIGLFHSLPTILFCLTPMSDNHIIDIPTALSDPFSCAKGISAFSFYSSAVISQFRGVRLYSGQFFSLFSDISQPPCPIEGEKSGC